MDGCLLNLARNSFAWDEPVGRMLGFCDVLLNCSPRLLTGFVRLVKAGLSLFIQQQKSSEVPGSPALPVHV
jgi:hypothetical protein